MSRGADDPALTQERITYHERVYPVQVGRRVRFWRDVEVRRFLIAQVGFLTLDEARADLAASFEPWRVPSRSAIDRFWQVLKRLERHRLALPKASR